MCTCPIKYAGRLNKRAPEIVCRDKILMKFLAAKKIEFLFTEDRARHSNTRRGSFAEHFCEPRQESDPVEQSAIPTSSPNSSRIAKIRNQPRHSARSRRDQFEDSHNELLRVCSRELPSASSSSVAEVRTRFFRLFA